LFGLAVAFLSPLPNQALLTLVEKICGQTNAALTRWVPHVTLRIGEPDYIKRAVTAIAELFTPFAVRIESLELYECGEGYANFIQRFELVKGNDENA
jgi:hypothetical protein